MPRLALVTAVLLSAFLVMHLPRSMDPLDAFAVAEQARVRAHLDSAERELRAERGTGWTVSQRAARARALDRLHEYWVGGVFPRNRDFPGALVPSFVDDRTGTRCAMAYLIDQSGHGDFVARIAATRNNARIADLGSDPQLIAWLDGNGITLEEAARIQPAYCGEFQPPCLTRGCSCPSAPAASTGYKTATGASVSADVLAVLLNTSHAGIPRSLSGVLGVATGMIGMMIGVPNFDQSGSQRTLGWVNAGGGAVSAAFGVYRLTGKRSTVAPVSFAPWVSSGGAAGLSARLTF